MTKGVEKVRFLSKKIMWITAAVGFGILLGLLLPVQFVAGVEAVIIVIICICSCCRR